MEKVVGILKVPGNERSRERKFHHGNECSRERIVLRTNAQIDQIHLTFRLIYIIWYHLDQLVYVVVAAVVVVVIVQCGRKRSSMSNPWWRCNIYT